MYNLKSGSVDKGRGGTCARGDKTHRGTRQARVCTQAPTDTHKGSVGRLLSHTQCVERNFLPHETIRYLWRESEYLHAEIVVEKKEHNTQIQQISITGSLHSFGNYSTHFSVLFFLDLKSSAECTFFRGHHSSTMETFWSFSCFFSHLRSAE